MVGITNIYVQNLAFSTTNAADQTLFVGTHGLGVFRSTDGSNLWEPVSNGLPHAINMQQIGLSPNYTSDHTLFAAT
jgi:hypothetical protein